MSALPESLNCYHCGLPAPAASGLDLAVVIGGVSRSMCCPGCAAVAQAIVDSGFSDYYRNRTEFAATAEAAPLVPAQLAELDRSAGTSDAGTTDAMFSVDGIRCAACAWLIERQLARLPGVLDSAMNLSSGRLRVRMEPGQVKVSDVVQSLRAIGYTAYPFDAARHDAALEKERKGLFRKLFIAGLSMMQVMMYALPAYVADDGTMDADMAGLMRWASLLLTAPAVLYSALPFYRGAWRGIVARMPGMDLPVAIGVIAASVASVIATVRGAGEVYFDSVTMFVFLLLASRYLELLARRRASRGLEQLRHALPASATRLVDGRSEVVAAASLAVDDVISVAPGEAIAADGVVIAGSSEIDVALLTGEARAQPCAAGAEVPGGAVNIAQPLTVRVTRPAGDSTLSQLVRLAEQAGEGKPHIGTWADKVAAWFVVALLLLTVVVFGAWQLVEPARAWQVAIAVLVVSCPCALSLATPSALAAATSILVKRGVLVVQPHVLETLHRATHVVFDKTGTLTQGKPVLAQVQPLAWLDRQRCLGIAAALEAGSVHPLADAIRAGYGFSARPAQDVVSVAGQGVSGTVDGVSYRLGRASFACAGHVASDDAAECTSVYLGDGARAFARFDLSDALRPEAAAVVADLQARGKQVMILSGDADNVARKVADQLGIRTAIGRQLPEQKLACVRRLQQGGAVVAMVGDGINDAAVLRAADVSFAMGSGSALAQLNADCVLVSGRLQSLADCMQVAARTLRVVRQNLGWATVYNAVAIPAAACGLINPWVSAVGMSASSALVVLNALRLMRDRTTERRM